MLFSCTSIPLNNFLHVVGNTSVPLNPARNWVQHKILSLIFIFKYLRSSNSVFVPPAIPRNRSSLLFISSSGYWSWLDMHYRIVFSFILDTKVVKFSNKPVIGTLKIFIHFLIKKSPRFSKLFISSPCTRDKGDLTWTNPWPWYHDTTLLEIH